MACYVIPMVISIIYTMIIIYLFGGDTIGEVLICPFFNVFAYIPWVNIPIAVLGVIYLFVILLSEIGDIKIR